MIAHHAMADIYHSPGPFTSTRPDFINGGMTSGDSLLQMASQ